MIDSQFYNPKIQQDNYNYNQEQRMDKQQDNDIISPSQLFVCFEQNKKMIIPLRNVNYHLKIYKGLQIVEFEQIYSTETFKDPLDLEYVFSINENAAVTKMKIELGEKTVYGIVKETEEAKQEFDEGIKQGKTMAYSEADIKFPQIKRLKIGQLGPNKQLKVTFQYIQPLEVFLNKFWKIDLTPLIDQNYQCTQENAQIGFKEILKHLDTIFKLRDFTLQYKQDIEIILETGSPITFWKSPTHTLHSINEKDQDKQQHNCDKLILKLDDIPENHNPQKIFTLLFSSDDINQPRAILSHTNNDQLLDQKYCATLTFIPQLFQISLDDAYQQYLDNISIPQNQIINRGNYIFIIDRSGSMNGSKIEKAKQSLILFLKSLPNHSFFNIISFGTNYLSLWNESKKYTQTTLQDAIKHVQNMTANLGGTNIYNPLKEMIYNRNYGISNDTTLNVFLLTDGLDDADPIIKLVKGKNKAETRIYTLGIGEDCSYYLVKRIAEEGNGKFHVVREDGDINEKVIDLLEDSLTPYLKDFQLETNAQKVSSIIPNPESIVSLKKNQELTIQILFSNKQDQKDIEFSIHCFYSQDQKPIKYNVSLNLNQSQENEYFHKLAAHKFITYYENALRYGEEQVNFIKLNKYNIEDKDIVYLSIENQILSNKTAFVCEVCELEDQLKQKIRSKITINHTKQQFGQNCLEKKKNSYLNRFMMTSSFMPLPQGNPTMYPCAPFMQFMPQMPNQMFGFRSPIGIKNIQTENIQPSFENIKPTFENLIEFAQADGSFKISNDIYLRVNFLNINNLQGLNDDIWNTFLILLYLEKFCSQFKKSWQLVFSKAVLYLHQNGIDYKQKKLELVHPQE